MDRVTDGEGTGNFGGGKAVLEVRGRNKVHAKNTEELTGTEGGKNLLVSA